MRHICKVCEIRLAERNCDGQCERCWIESRKRIGHLSNRRIRFVHTMAIWSGLLSGNVPTTRNVGKGHHDRSQNGKGAAF